MKIFRLFLFPDARHELHAEVEAFFVASSTSLWFIQLLVSHLLFVSTTSNPTISSKNRTRHLSKADIQLVPIDTSLSAGSIRSPCQLGTEYAASKSFSLKARISSKFLELEYVEGSVYRQEWQGMLRLRN